MKKTICAALMGAAAFALGSEARAAGQWGLNTGDTLGAGDKMVYGEIGWPDFSPGFQYGLTDRIDIGIRLSVIYGFEYMPEYARFGTVGLGARVPLRFGLVKGSSFSLMLRFEPGIKFDSFGNRNGLLGSRALLFGIQFPLALLAGVHLTREATLSFGMDIPFYVNLTNGVYGAIPILFGVGFEYHLLNDRLGIGLNTRFGPSILAANGGSDTRFGFITQIGVAYKF